MTSFDTAEPAAVAPTTRVKYVPTVSALAIVVWAPSGRLAMLAAPD